MENKQLIPVSDLIAKKICEAILNDDQLKKIYGEKALYYSLQSPSIVIKNNKAEFIVINEETHPILSKFNEMIKNRIEEINHYYNNL